jgi:hypothetical protein
MGVENFQNICLVLFTEQGVAMILGVLNSQTAIATPRDSYTMTATKICVLSVIR